MTRLRRLAPTIFDVVVGVGLGTAAVVEVLTSEAFAGHEAGGVILAAGLTFPFAVRSRHPRAVLLVAWTSCILGSLLLTSFFNLETPFLLLMLSAYTAGRLASLREAVGLLGYVLLALCVVNLTNPDAVGGDYLFPGGFAIAMWAGARTLRNRTLLAAELHEAAIRAEERREEAAARAVAAERRRIAREMHDLVGHSVSVMVVQAGGARRILDRDPDRAVEAAVRIETTGRQALAEMRRLLGLLGAEADALTPQPTLGDVVPLVERARAAGLPVTMTVDGVPRGLPAGAEAAAYRIVQEALTNALKHAAAAATDVLLRWDPDGLEIVVADRGPGSGPLDVMLPGGGHGLVGMRERVRVYGGELTARPRPDGGFVVRARIPLRQEELQAA